MLSRQVAALLWLANKRQHASAIDSHHTGGGARAAHAGDQAPATTAPKKAAPPARTNAETPEPGPEPARFPVEVVPGPECNGKGLTAVHLKEGLLARHCAKKQTPLSRGSTVLFVSFTSPVHDFDVRQRKRDMGAVESGPKVHDDDDSAVGEYVPGGLAGAHEG